jgi:4-hydroxybenzoate polyprenyltransferase
MVDSPDNSGAREPALCVDLEGALITVDFKWEGRIRALAARALHPLKRGAPTSEQQLASHFGPGFPHRADVLEYLQSQQQSGRRIILLSRLPHDLAQGLVETLGFTPDQFITHGSLPNGDVRSALGADFDLISGRDTDAAIWAAARRVYPTSRSKTSGRETDDRFDIRRRPLVALLRAMRPHQWIKNVLVLIPLVLAHQLTDRGRVVSGVFAFCAMCLCASAVYVVNDLLDIQADRRHPAKRRRPFASGRASIPGGLLLVIACLTGSVAFLAPLPWKFGAALGLYLLLTTAYSVWLKRKPLVDVMLLAALYTLRIIAGAMAVQVMLTMWLLAFSMFFFLSLAFVKRYSELVQIEHAGGDEPRGRGYSISDLQIIEAAGTASGYMSVLVFCNYLDSAMVRSLYARPQVLWLVAPLLLYWITRCWLLARRRLMHDDPVVFALRDRTSRICGVLAVVVILLAWSGWPHV